MEIKEALEALVKKVEGGIASILISEDGEAINWCSVDPSFDVEWIGARFGVVVRDLVAAVKRQDQGMVRGIVVEFERGGLVISPLGEFFFLLLLIQPDGNLGQALFHCRMSASRIEKELAA
ncbi:MAG: hypothetical protein QHH30_11865 [candidate division NC10 bacterium]|nr:hypothetical protein [candidate division NC10 bacterium]